MVCQFNVLDEVFLLPVWMLRCRGHPHLAHFRQDIISEFSWGRGLLRVSAMLTRRCGFLLSLKGCLQVEPPLVARRLLWPGLCESAPLWLGFFDICQTGLQSWKFVFNLFQVARRWWLRPCCLHATCIGHLDQGVIVIHTIVENVTYWCRQAICHGAVTGLHRYRPIGLSGVQNDPGRRHLTEGDDGSVATPLVAAKLVCFIEPLPCEARLVHRLFFQKVRDVNAEGTAIASIKIGQGVEETIAVTDHFHHTHRHSNRCLQPGGVSVARDQKMLIIICNGYIILSTWKYPLGSHRLISLSTNVWICTHV